MSAVLPYFFFINPLLSVTHLTLKIIRVLSEQNLGCVPRIASNALQPGKILLVENLQRQNKM